MALQYNLATSDVGVACPEAYAKIMSFTGYKSIFIVYVFVYASQAARNADNRPVKVMTFNCPVPTSAPFNYLYDYMKTLPEFDTAIDV